MTSKGLDLSAGSHRLTHFCFAVASILLISGCGSTIENVALGAAGATVSGARTPSHEIEQIYYLGSLDPQGQLPPMIYRVRVHGQASLISNVNFATGWVHASLIDSLSSRVGFNEDSGEVSISHSKNDENLSKLQTGRRLTQFGPEGFREAPQDHRLVIVMGSNPEAFFKAVDQALGEVSKAVVDQKSNALRGKLIEEYLRMEAHSQQLGGLQSALEREGQRVGEQK